VVAPRAGAGEDRVEHAETFDGNVLDTHWHVHLDFEKLDEPFAELDGGGALDARPADGQCQGKCSSLVELLPILPASTRLTSGRCLVSRAPLATGPITGRAAVFL
jgi:hypothetical protein